jgi:hypothetical protein
MFRLTEDAKDWYKKIKDSDNATPLFSEEFDLYYFCLLFGLSEDQKEINEPLVDMSKNFTLKYKKSKEILLTFLMLRHAQKRKIKVSDKKSLQKLLDKFCDKESESGTGLSTAAIDTMNHYAAGGFPILRKIVPNFTNSVVAIDLIHKKLKSSLDKFSEIKFD